MSEKKAMVPVGKIEQRILLIRSEKVIVDADLAEFYGVLQGAAGVECLLRSQGSEIGREMAGKTGT